MMQITIIIPNYNGKELLENCIHTLEKQTFQDFKVLVVDNGSTDGSCEISSETLNLEYIRLSENQGFCGAVNIGIRHTRTPYLILLNNDTEAEEHFVEKLYEGIQRSQNIFSCEAQMIDFKDHTRMDNAGDYYTALGWAVARGRGKKVENYQTPKRVFSCCAGAAIYRTGMFQEIGMLDEHHFAYLEDVDLGYRARIHGYENWYEPEAKIYHVGSATTGNRYNEKKVFLAARNTIFVLYKNMPMIQLILNLPLILTGIAIKSVFFAKKGFAGTYLKGIAQGITKCHSCPKVPFQWKHLGSYFRIQGELWLNIIRIFCASILYS